MKKDLCHCDEHHHCEHCKHKIKVLFILRKRESPIFNGPYGYTSSPGLNNSAKFVSDMLNQHGYKSKVAEVFDNNGIDALVYRFRPKYVVIEALWVVPEKFKVLQKLHPDVKWIIRVHSEVPFLQNEGISIEWLTGYLNHKNVYIAFNSKETADDFVDVYRAMHKESHHKILYLPNYYPVYFQHSRTITDDDIINIGCFGAVRPMKNQLIQAMAAIEYARQTGKRLRYHINATRIEGRGEPVLKNIRTLFASLPESQFRLIEHPWLSHHEFMELIRSFDIGLQVSFSETFNIVAADFISAGVPVVVSKEIDWVPSIFWADPTSVDDIVRIMHRAVRLKELCNIGTYLNQYALIKFSRQSVVEWTNILR